MGGFITDQAQEMLIMCTLYMKNRLDQKILNEVNNVKSDGKKSQMSKKGPEVKEVTLTL